MLNSSILNFAELCFAPELEVHVHQHSWPEQAPVLQKSISRHSNTVVVPVQVKIDHWMRIEKEECCKLHANIRPRAEFLFGKYECIESKAHLDSCARPKKRHHPCHAHLKQGSVLGPLLFNIYVADLPSLAREHGAKMPSFADDMTLYCSHTSAALACSSVSAALKDTSRALALRGLQCIRKFLSQTLFDFKRMVSHSISPKFSGKIPYVLSKPRICFLGSKDKKFCVKQV